MGLSLAELMCQGHFSDGRTCEVKVRSHACHRTKPATFIWFLVLHIENLHMLLHVLRLSGNTEVHVLSNPLVVRLTDFLVCETPVS